MVNTASTTSAASCFANALLTLVASEVYATLMSVARSRVAGCLNLSKNWCGRVRSVQVRRGKCMMYLKCRLLCQVKTFRDDCRMHTLRDVPIRLLQQLANKQDDRRRAVADLVILRDCGTRNHRGCGVLDLHL